MRNNIVLAVIAVLMMLTGSARAEVSILDAIKQAVPSASQGIVYNIQGHEANMVSAFEVIGKDFKYGSISLDGYYGESDLGGIGLMYKTSTLESLGLNVIIIKDLFAKVGYSVGYDHITTAREFSQGPMATLGANIKFGPQTGK